MPNNIINKIVDLSSLLFLSDKKGVDELIEKWNSRKELLETYTQQFERPNYTLTLQGALQTDLKFCVEH